MPFIPQPQNGYFHCGSVWLVTSCLAQNALVLHTSLTFVHLCVPFLYTEWELSISDCIYTYCMWPDLRKGVFHINPIPWTWRTITQYLQTWKFSHLLSYVGTHYCPNFMAMDVFNLKLWIIQVGKLDVHGRPLSTNPVTYYGFLFAIFSIVTGLNKDEILCCCTCNR